MNVKEETPIIYIGLGQGPGYLSGINKCRTFFNVDANRIDKANFKIVDVTLSPAADTPTVKFYLRHSDLYIMGWKGARKSYFTLDVKGSGYALPENSEILDFSGDYKSLGVDVTLQSEREEQNSSKKIDYNNIKNQFYNLYDKNSNNNHCHKPYKHGLGIMAVIVSEAIRFDSILGKGIGMVNGLESFFPSDILPRAQNWEKLSGQFHYDVMVPHRDYLI